jgi:hypothetical protein
MFPNVNGFPVVAGCQRDGSNAVVVADRGEDGPTDRYVAWRLFRRTDGTVEVSSGFYTPHLERAKRNMAERA